MALGKTSEGYFTISSAAKPPTGPESLEMASCVVIAFGDESAVAKVNERVMRATLPIIRVIFVFMDLELECYLRSSCCLPLNYFLIVIMSIPPPFSVFGATSSSVQEVKTMALETAISRA